ncbi:MAG TPA: hypothetical protein VFY61_03690 [Pyrinomonadaceae bacterium]|nr:hypothetical protein [Pyrinomonadaceae bacterium]
MIESRILQLNWEKTLPPRPGSRRGVCFTAYELKNSEGPGHPNNRGGGPNGLSFARSR